MGSPTVYMQEEQDFEEFLAESEFRRPRRFASRSRVFPGGSSRGLQLQGTGLSGMGFGFRRHNGTHRVPKLSPRHVV